MTFIDSNVAFILRTMCCLGTVNTISGPHVLILCRCWTFLYKKGFTSLCTKLNFFVVGLYGVSRIHFIIIVLNRRVHILQIKMIYYVMNVRTSSCLGEGGTFHAPTTVPGTYLGRPAVPKYSLLVCLFKSQSYICLHIIYMYCKYFSMKDRECMSFAYDMYSQNAIEGNKL